MKRFPVKLRNEIIQRLVKEFDPESIFLFGSYAWGQPDESSDVDLLVVIRESQQSPAQRSVRAQRSLRGVLFPVDVLVKTREEVDQYRSVYASLESQIMDEGKLLYGREA